MTMYQNGDIDSSLAMQLLGGALAAGGGGDSKKRPLEGASGSEGVKAAKTDDTDHDAPSVDDLLDQAKKVKNDARLNSSQSYFLGHKHIYHHHIWVHIYYVLDDPGFHGISCSKNKRHMWKKRLSITQSWWP